MKRISTLFTALAALFTVQSYAQFTENFEDPYKIVPANCWNLNQIYPLAYGINTFFDFRLTGNGDLVCDPPVNETQTSDVYTPTLNITSTSFTVKFNYRTNTDIKGKSYRTIEVGLQDVGGYTFLDKITVDASTVDPNLPHAYNKTFTLASTGAKRLVFKFGGDAGVGVTRLIFDDLYASASPRYASGCNSAPVAVPDNFTSLLMSAYSGNVITNAVGGSDNEPDGEILSATLLTQPLASQGTVALNSNGTFTFTPSGSFTGGLVTFTYQLTDNGYAPLTSNTATVTIEYPSALKILPVKLMSFGGHLENQKARLNWAVAENESGNYFEVLKSNDGRTFGGGGIVFTSEKAGAESYAFAENAEAETATFYKLRIVDKDGSVSYSGIIMLKRTADQETNTLSVLQNPVVSTLTFSYTTSAARPATVTIYNMAGVRVFSTRTNSQQGTNSVSLNLDSRMTAGTYILEVASGNERYVTKLLKQ